MTLPPQSPPLPVPSGHPYPSPRSKSPTSTTQYKGSRKLPVLKYPLTDITNFTLAKSTLQLSNLAPILANDERLVAQARELLNDVSPRKSRGKSRRGRQRAVRIRDIGSPVSGVGALRSPIPLASSARPSSHSAFNFRVPRRKYLSSSPILSSPPSHKSPDSSNVNQSPPRHRIPSVSAVTPDTPRHACKRKKRWSSTSPRGKSVSPPSPLSPTPIARRSSRCYNGLPTTNSAQQLPHLSFPVPPPSAPAFARPSHVNHEQQQFSLLPAMNLGPGLTQTKGRKKRTKRELAEIQWQITLHKSLAWRTTREYMKLQRRDTCKKCNKAEVDSPLRIMNLAQGGLRIAIEQPVCICASDDEPNVGRKNAQMHWTDSLDRELVKRLWVKLIAQGCRTVPTGHVSHRPPGVPTPFPTIDHSQSGIPFPSESSEPQLAPAIQLPSTSYPASQPQIDPGFSPRRRVSAMTFTSQTRPPVFHPNQHISSPQHYAAANTPTRLTAEHPSPDSCTLVPWTSAPTPRGTLTPAQLTAQAILRNSDAHSKPMRRARPPGITPRASSLRREITIGHAD